MKTFIIFAIIICLANSLFGQSYELRYIETVHLSNVPKIKLNDSAIKKIKELPIDSATLTDHINNVIIQKFTFGISHLVKVINDTCYDEASPDNLAEGTQLNLTDSYKIIYKGRRINPENMDTAFPNKIINIHPNGKVKTILKYACENYTSDDGTLSIWFCKTLSNAINPGVTDLSLYPGAILAYEFEGKSATQKMEATEINIL
jgi:hypothetical protein